MRLYKVGEGDTIFSICIMHRLTWERFIVLNPDYGVTGLKCEGDLKVGDTVVVGIKDPLKYVR
jgi:hypothetical protein